MKENNEKIRENYKNTMKTKGDKLNPKTPNIEPV